MQLSDDVRARGVDALQHIVLDVGSDGAVLRALAETRSAELVVPCESVVELEVPPTTTVAGAIFGARMTRKDWFAAGHVLRHRWPGIPLALTGAETLTSTGRARARELDIELVRGEPEACRDELVGFVVRAHTRRLQQCQRMDAQFDEWRLTPRERELAALIAFGLKRPAWKVAMGGGAMMYQWARRLRSASGARRSAELIPVLTAMIEPGASPPTLRHRAG